MKRFLIFIILLTGVFASKAQDSTVVAQGTATLNVSDSAAIISAENSASPSTGDDLSQAAELYAKGAFAAAAVLYEKAIAEKGISAKAYYNLGNCYFKANRIAPAILNYERALLLDPGDGDTRHNLTLARLKTVDKIEPVGEFFLSLWFRSVQNLLSAGEWSILAITAFILFIGCLFLFFFTRRISLKKTGFYIGLVFLAVCIISNIFAYNEKHLLTNRRTAIVFSPTVTIKSSPDASGTDLFILHEGTKVTIKSRVGNWNEIETADGNVGWIRNDEIEVI